MSDAAVIPVGARATVQGKLNLGPGTVRYVGLTKFQTGRWVGIVLDEKNGKNDGEVQGVRYFECAAEHGIFVKPSQVVLLDTPPAEPEAPSSPQVTKKAPAKEKEKEAKKASPTTSPTTSKLKKSATSATTTTTTSSTKPKTIASTAPAIKTTTASKLSTSPSKPKVGSGLKPSSRPSSGHTSPLSSSPTAASPLSLDPPRAPSPAKVASKLAKHEKEKEDEEEDEDDMLAGDFPDDDEDDEDHAHEEEEEQTKERKEIEEETPKPKPTPKIETAVPVVDTSSRSESVDRMMVALKELNEFKVKAQETIEKLTRELAEETNQKSKLVKEHEKELQRISREHDSEIKQLQKQGAKEEKGQQQLQTWETAKQELQEQINSLTENLEMITLDKEIAEEKVESLEADLLSTTEELAQATTQLNAIEEEKKARLESLNKDGGSGGGSNTEECLALMEQNEKLKEALVKLRDFSVNEKQEATKKIKELEKSAKLLPGLTEKSNKLEEDLNTKLQEMEELKQLVDDANASQDLIDELSDKNLNLTEKVEELNTTLSELEDLRTVSEELEESQAQAMKDLRSELNKREMTLLNREGDLANWQLKCSDQEKTVNQFRDLVTKLQRDIAKMKEMSQEENAQINEIVSREKNLMNMNYQLQTQVARGTAQEVAQHLDRIKATEAVLQSQFVRTFIPEKHFQADNDAIRFVLLSKRVSSKTEMLRNLLQKTHKHDSIVAKYSQPVVKDEESSDLPINDVTHSLLVEMWLYKLDEIANDIGEALTRADVELYLKAGKATYEAELLEKSLDPLIALIRDEQFGPNYPVDELEKLVQRFETLKTAQLGTTSVRPPWRIIQSEVTIISYTMLLLLGETAKLDLPDMTRKRTAQVFEACRKLLKQVPSNTNFQSSSIVFESLHASNQKATKILQALKQAKTELIDTTTANGIIDKHFDGEFKLSLHGDEEGANTMEKVLFQIEYSIRDVVESILAGDLDVHQTEKDAQAPTVPWVVRGQQAQAQLSEVGNLKDKLSQKETEVVDLQKQMKVKDQDLQEEQYKVESLDKRLRNSMKNQDDLHVKYEQEVEKATKLEKTYEEALESMRKDHAALEAKNVTLQNKLTNLSADRSQKTASLASFGAALSQVAIGGSVQVANYELEALKTAIRHLHNENARLKAEVSQRELASLLSSSPSLSAAQSKVQPNDVAQIGKEISAYVDELHYKLASVKVVNLAQPRSEKSAKPSKSSSHTQPFVIPLRNAHVEALQLQQVDMANLQLRGKETREKLQKLLGEANTSFAKFPSPITAQALRNIQPVLLGKVQIPAHPSSLLPLSFTSPYPSQILLTKAHEFEQIHSQFVK